jgi:hypothetical protein
MLIYYIKIVVNLLHVSVNFCGHLRFFYEGILQRQVDRKFFIWYGCLYGVVTIGGDFNVAGCQMVRSA